MKRENAWKKARDMAECDSNIFFSYAEQIEIPSGKKISVLRDNALLTITERLNISIGETYTRAMETGIWPLRYIRNFEIISLADQIRLAKSTVTVVGAGGLGGNIILILSRLGVGNIKVVDGDTFDESNLNRQALSSVENLGTNKAKAAKDFVARINPATLIIPYEERLTQENARHILSGSDVVVDALDNVQTRFLLQETIDQIRIPLVHGALAGFEGQLMTIFPGDPGLTMVYGQKGDSAGRKKGPEAILGVPAPTASLVATLQVMEVIKIILGKEGLFRKRLVHMDLLLGRIHSFSLE